MCLLLKMLQIQPDEEIIVELIKNEEYKYVRVLGAMYLRCTGRPADVYKYLEPLYVDYSKIRFRNFEGSKITHVDEFVDQLLTEDYSCDIALPHLPKCSQAPRARFVHSLVRAVCCSFRAWRACLNVRL